MDILKELVSNIVAIVLLTTFLDLLLPSSSMQRFVKVVMGLFILVSLLNPILELLSRDQEFEVFSWQQPQAVASNSILLGSQRLKDTNEELFLDNYRQLMEKQMESLLKLVRGIESVQVNLELKNGEDMRAQEGIKNVQVIVLSMEGGEIKENAGLVDPIIIQIENKAQEDPVNDAPRKAETGGEKRTEQEIRHLLTQYFGLQQTQIIVFFS